MEYKTKQRKGYDCGVVTVVSLLKYFKIDYDNYQQLEKELKTTKEYGTLPENMIKTLSDYGLNVLKGIGNVGFVLVNENLLYKENKPGNNGHWCFYEQVNKKINLYDVWEDTTESYSIKELVNLTKDVIVNNKPYNNLILNTEKQ